MKKSRILIASIVLVLLIAFSALILTSCADKNTTGEKEILVVAPDGAPTMALAKLLSEKPQFDGYKVTYSILPGTVNIAAEVMKADIALVPSILGANLYNKGEDIRMIGANVYGLLYLLGKDNITELTQLKGKVVHSLGAGNTPEFIFKYALSQAGIAYQNSDTVIDNDTVSIKYEEEATTIIQKMVANQVQYAILGEPQATMAISKNSAFKVLFDLQEIYGGGYPQVATLAKGDLADNHKAFLAAFMNELKANNEWAVANPDKVQSAMTESGSKITGLTADIITRCNIRFTEMKSALIGTVEYLTVVKGFNSKLIGGKVPAEAFFQVIE